MTASKGKSSKKEKPEKKATILELQRHFKQMIYEISGMELAIVSAVVIEEFLSRLLDHVLLSFSEDITFSAKIHLAYSIGVISGRERICLDVLRKIRNDFAHSFIDLSFDAREIKELLSCSAVKKEMHLRFLHTKKPELDCEQTFRELSSSLVIGLAMRPMHFKKFKEMEDLMARETLPWGEKRHIGE